MSYIIAVVILVAIGIAYDYASGLWLDLSAHVARGGADIRLLKSFIRVGVQSGGDVPAVEVRVGGIRVMRRFLIMNRRERKSIDVARLARAVQYRSLTVDAAYGLQDPFQTGVTFASLNALAAVFPIGEISLRPDFTADGAYADIRAHAKLSLSHTMVNYWTRRKASWNKT